MKGKSNSYEPHQASVSTTLKALLNVPLTGEKSFTVELALGVKRQTLKARSNTFVTATPYSGHMQNIGVVSPRLKCICGVNVDRDLNGARGIYLRALGATPWFKHLFKPAIVNLS